MSNTSSALLVCSYAPTLVFIVWLLISQSVWKGMGTAWSRREYGEQQRARQDGARLAGRISRSKFQYEGFTWSGPDVG